MWNDKGWLETSMGQKGANEMDLFWPRNCGLNFKPRGNHSFVHGRLVGDPAPPPPDRPIVAEHARPRKQKTG
jgi:hypothetical protein